MMPFLYLNIENGFDYGIKTLMLEGVIWIFIGMFVFIGIILVIITILEKRKWKKEKSMYVSELMVHNIELEKLLKEITNVQEIKNTKLLKEIGSTSRGLEYSSIKYIFQNNNFLKIVEFKNHFVLNIAYSMNYADHAKKIKRIVDHIMDNMKIRKMVS